MSRPTVVARTWEEETKKIEGRVTCESNNEKADAPPAVSAAIICSSIHRDNDTLETLGKIMNTTILPSVICRVA